MSFGFASWLLVLGWVPMLVGVRRQGFGRGEVGRPRAAEPARGPEAPGPPERPARCAPEAREARDESERRFTPSDRIQVLLTWLACIAATGFGLRGVENAPRPLRWAGVLLFLVSVGLWSWARRAHGLDYAQLPRAPRSLATTGPYRFVRHPLYIATAGAVFGQGLVGASLAGLGLGVALSILLFVRARHEERLLERAFGSEWQEYSEHVPRAWPRRMPSRPR